MKLKRRRNFRTDRTALQLVAALCLAMALVLGIGARIISPSADQVTSKLETAPSLTKRSQASVTAKLTPRREPSLLLPHPEAAALVDRLRKELLSRLEDSDEYAIAQRCREDTQIIKVLRVSDCDTLRTRALRGVLEGGFFQALDERQFGIADLQAALGTSRLATELYTVATSSTDELERIVGVAVLDRLPGYIPTSWPDRTYLRLEGLSEIESSLLLARHSIIPLESVSAIEAVVDLALSDEAPRLSRLNAVMALGHPETAVELSGTIRTLADDDKTMRHRTALALASCGEACRPLLDELAASNSPDERMTAATAIARLPSENEE